MGGVITPDYDMSCECLLKSLKQCTMHAVLNQMDIMMFVVLVCHISIHDNIIFHETEGLHSAPVYLLDFLCQT